ncbi:hypothetical protein MKJ04_03280 [Pontibacter sp. E15-1]|uniref:hypothetical protein n=1 Tax=Pontibacter sp. E15-1 TaxID=2919918 RepID=UPI001F5024C1|nr:hypothetical protein [Pontibacter sp. E15-1]MCJ8163849.1 hypothetical protein [Pontibacter sp. E15-1]
MNKNVIAVFAAVCGLFLASCDTPKDMRPDAKVSVDMVPPGTRNTHNIGKVNEVHHESHEAEVMPNHDAGGNTIEKGDSLEESTETNTVLGTTKE